MTTRSPLFSTGNIGPCGPAQGLTERMIRPMDRLRSWVRPSTTPPFIMDGAPDHQAQSAQRPEYRNDYEAASDQGRMEPSMDITASRDRTSEMFASEGQPTASSDVASTQRDTNMSMDPAKTANSSTPLQAPLTMGRVPAL
ncbi:hypothetical protein I302_107793 [Kwoniella bestiolae CBS 10118]|uniref:Uncharacterized protein n=1 Tax=Kwoniella bestiolae CBS 10118 TaxID=1296100 RepID=A0A1B9FXJ7_9TREE|nr:hypothetical protein I302_06468 [Kwoniella bestiolae CBS 10118]OCF23486.1 hypothetical protein I302_06468 [Kwoniella bestiolae CBS 10118]